MVLEHNLQIYSKAQCFTVNDEHGDTTELHIWSKLSLNIAKTEFMVIGSRQRLATFENNDLNIFVNDKKIKKVQTSESLGLTIDEHLTWKNHINNSTKKISSGISALKRVNVSSTETQL